MIRAWEWYKRRHWLVKVALAIPVLLVAVLVFVVRGKSSDPASVKLDDATDAIDRVAGAADDAIKTIERENDAIQNRADARGDATTDAASEPCGQFDSAADLYSKR